MTKTEEPGFFFCVGFPDQALLRVINILCQLVHKGEMNEVGYILANSATDFLNFQLKNYTNTRVIASHIPDESMLGTFSSAGLPTILVLRSFLQHAKETSKSVETMQALRGTQLHARQYLELIERTNCLIIDPADLDKDFHQVVRQISEHVGKSIGDNTQDLSPQNPSIDSNSEDTDQIFRLNLAGYDKAINNIRNQKHFVSRDLLFLGPESSMSDRGYIDLTGRAGLITYGPYLPLSQGRWRGTFTFAAAKNTIGVTLQFLLSLEGSAGSVQGALLDYVIRYEGRHDVDLNFNVDENNYIVQIQVNKSKPLFEGDIIVGYQSFELLEQKKYDALEEIFE